MDKHFLLNEFPGKQDKIRQLRVTDEHFKELCDQYNSVNHEVEKIENGLENTSDAYLNTLKLKRVELKDALAGFLQ